MKGKGERDGREQYVYMVMNLSGDKKGCLKTGFGLWWREGMPTKKRMCAYKFV